MKANIMVVDDNPDVLYAVKEGLEIIDPEFNVTTVGSGIECLKKIESVKPDLLLLDIMMPELDGLTLAKWLKKEPDTRDIPILYLTAKGDFETKKAAVETCVDYIEKPFKIFDLRERVERALGKKSGTKEGK